MRRFFETYIAIRDPERISRLKKKGILVEIRSASELLKKLLNSRFTGSDCGEGEEASRKILAVQTRR